IQISWERKDGIGNSKSCFSRSQSIVQIASFFVPVVSIGLYQNSQEREKKAHKLTNSFSTTSFENKENLENGRVRSASMDGHAGREARVTGHWTANECVVMRIGTQKQECRITYS